MKHKWLFKDGAERLLLFFNGWGMDERPIGHLEPDGLDVLMFYDYTSAELGVDLGCLTGGYGSVELVAWSMGVYAAACALGHGNGFECATAVNGTLSPVDDEAGIPAGVFNATLAGLQDESASSATRRKFERRMCGGGEAARFFEAHKPARADADVAAELAALGSRSRAVVASNIYTRAVVGEGDRIFPPGAQAACWERAGVDYATLELPHYPFMALSRWTEVGALGRR